MKRLLLFFLCLGLMAALTACGTTEHSQNSSSADVERSALPETPSSQEVQENGSEAESSPETETSQESPEQTDSDVESEPQTNQEPTEPVQNSLPAEPLPPQENPEETGGSVAEQEPETILEETEMKLNVEVNGTTFTATLEDNTAVDAFVEMMHQAPMVIEMRDYAGFEKVGSLGTSLPTSNSQTTTQAGDIVLYQGNQIVIFYGSNSWSYTRLGKIDDLTGWEEALSNGDVTVTFSIGG